MEKMSYNPWLTWRGKCFHPNGLKQYSVFKNLLKTQKSPKKTLFHFPKSKLSLNLEFSYESISLNFPRLNHTTVWDTILQTKNQSQKVWEISQNI